MKPIQEISKRELDDLEIVTFDIDGVIAPVGTELRESADGAELFMKSKQPSRNFKEVVGKLKKYLKVNFSSGRNILYLKSLFNDLFDDRIILQAENGNITLLDNLLVHPAYGNEYFYQLRDIRERIKKMMEGDSRIRGFEPKLFILTAHCDEMEEIPKLVEEIGQGNLYCLWTNEGYDIGSKEMSKGKAIVNLAEHFKINPKQIMTTGNNYNDQEMLEKGRGVTVNRERAAAEYYIESRDKKLGGELLAEFLLDYFTKYH